MATQERILVTGGSGFLASYCIIDALRQNYTVRTTVRSLKRTEDVRQMLQNGGVAKDQVDGVEFVEADLSGDPGWQEACKDCAYVLHVASPFWLEVPKDPYDMIRPAKEGTLRVLRAAKASGSVRRVVLTSSMGAISFGHPDQGWKAFTESDWSDVSSSRMKPYQMSKTLAERAAWDYIGAEGGSMELAVINPAGIFGPVLSRDYAASMEIIVRLVNGQLPGCPQLYFGVVDVRDVADMHVRAMTHPKASGERFIAVADDGTMSMQQMAIGLKKMLGDKGVKIPTRVVPNFVIRVMSWFDKAVATVVDELGIVRNASNAKAKEVLEWKPRGTQETLKEAAESLFRFDVAK